MKIQTFIILLFFSFITVFSQNTFKKGKNYKPKNLEEAVSQLTIIHDDSIKQKILLMTEEEFIGNTHMGLGLWIRNNWGLWKGKELAKYFNSIGIYHPDDMSGIILTCYFRELNKQDWKVQEQIKKYQEYWKAMNEHTYKLANDTAYQRIVKFKQDSIRQELIKMKRLEWSSGKKVSGYLEYNCGFLSGGERTQIKGTIIEWKEEKLLLHIDTYVDENKKERLIKCNNVKDDVVLIEYHDNFKLIEK
jgi:hypothetical protein